MSHGLTAEDNWQRTDGCLGLSWAAPSRMARPPAPNFGHGSGEAAAEAGSRRKAAMHRKRIRSRSELRRASQRKPRYPQSSPLAARTPARIPVAFRWELQPTNHKAVKTGPSYARRNVSLPCPPTQTSAAVTNRGGRLVRGNHQDNSSPQAADITPCAVEFLIGSPESEWATDLTASWLVRQRAREVGATSYSAPTSSLTSRSAHGLASLHINVPYARLDLQTPYCQTGRHIYLAIPSLGDCSRV